MQTAMSYGRYFEELHPGETFQHWPGRTITEFDDTLFSLMSMNQHPLHIDEHYAAGTQHGKRLVEGPLVISLVIGMTQADIGGRSIQTLEYSDVRHLGPIFHGDTIYAESTIIGAADGIVTIESRAVNQRREPVLSLRRRIALPHKADA